LKHAGRCRSWSWYEEAENNVVNNGGLDLGNLLNSANLYSDKPDKGDIDGKMVNRL